MKQHPISQRAGALALCFSLLAGLLFATAEAAEPTESGTGVYIGSTQLEMGKYYVVNKNIAEGRDVVTVLGDGQSYPTDNYAYLYKDTSNDTLTLELKNFTYNGGGQQITESGGSGLKPYIYEGAISATVPLILKLEGENSVTEDGSDNNRSCGVYAGNGLTITGSGSLTATGGASKKFSSYGVYISSGSLTVSGGALTGQGGQAGSPSGSPSESTGVQCYSEIIVSGNGKLEGIGGQPGTSTTQNTGSNYGVKSSRITVQGNGSLIGRIAEGVTAGTSSYGVQASSQIQVQDNGSLAGTGGKAESTGGKSYGVQASSGIQVAGGALTGTGGTAESGSSYGVSTFSSAVTVSGGHMVAQSGTATTSKAINQAPQIGEGFTNYRWRTSKTAETWNSSTETINTDDISNYLEIQEAYTVTTNVSPAGSGTVSGGGSYGIGDTVTLIASAGSGYQFAEWSVEDVTGVNTSANPLTFSMPDNGVSVTASFECTYPVTVVDSYSTLSGEGSYTENATVTIHAGSRDNYRFTGWTVTKGSVDLADPGSADTTFTMPAEPVTVTANWSRISSGGGSSRPSQPEPSVDVTTGTTTQGGQDTTETTARLPAEVENGAASATVSDSMGREIVQQAKENNSTSVVIAPEITGDVTSARVSLPSSTVGALGTETGASLTISTPVASVTIPNGGLGELAGETGTVTVSAEIIGHTVTLDITSGGRTVETLASGITLTVPVKDTTPGTVAVLIQADGSREVIRKSVAVEDTVTIPLSGSATMDILDNSGTFDDVTADSWYGDAVAFVSGHELFSGTGETIFAPGEGMTRGMLAQVLHNLESNPAAGNSAAFPDVAEGDWYADAVAWASEAGIVSGYGDGTFDAGDSITREQLAVMLYRYAQHMGYDISVSVSLTGYADAARISGYAAEAMQWANAAGLITGDTDTTLNPQGSATRAEVAAILMRFCTGGAEN